MDKLSNEEFLDVMSDHGLPLEYRAEINRRLDEGRKAIEWQPIETAPKDGTEFLARNNNQGGVKTLISWNKIHGYWQSKGKPILSMQDTHWIKIPDYEKEIK